MVDDDEGPLPHNIEVEQALLGALLVSGDAYDQICTFLRPAHFYTAVHGEIYEAIGRFIDQGKDPSPASLKTLFQDHDELKPLGGGRYLVDLAENVVSVYNVRDYANQVYDLHLRRAMASLAAQMAEEARRFDLEGGAADQIETIERKLYELASTGVFETDFYSISDSLNVAISQAETAYKNETGLLGVTTGLFALDERLGGLHPSDLVILAGRTGMGKTALAVTIAAAAARAHLDSAGASGAPVAYFSLEMSHDQLSSRLLATEAGISSDKMRRGEVSQQDFQRMVEARGAIDPMPLYIDQTPALSVPRLRVRARRLKRQHGLGLIVIDYLQLMDPSQRGENRVQQVTEITRGLKAIAKELQVPVLALSQLSRNIEQRDNKRPLLSDLRESGSIEQDADVVMFIHRESYYVEQSEPVRLSDESLTAFAARRGEWGARSSETHDQAECIIAKQRHGPTGTVKLGFDRRGPSFRSLLVDRKGRDA